MNKNKYIVWVLITALPLIGNSCYKKELDELKKVSFKTNRVFAFPLFETTLTLEDSLPVQLPGFLLSDTVKATIALGSYLGDYSNDMVDFAEFKIVLRGNFPANGKLQLYFADQYGNITDSLFSYNSLIINASYDETYTLSTVTAYMDREKYRRIEHASQIYLLYRLETAPLNAFRSSQLHINTAIKFGATF